MTQTKRILVFVLVLVLCIGLTVPAMAEDIIGAQYEKTAGYVAKTVASPGFGSIGSARSCQRRLWRKERIF